MSILYMLYILRGRRKIITRFCTDYMIYRRWRRNIGYTIGRHKPRQSLTHELLFDPRIAAQQHLYKKRLPALHSCTPCSSKFPHASCDTLGGDGRRYLCRS